MSNAFPLKRTKFVVVADISGFTAFLCGGLRSWTLNRQLAHYFKVERYANEASAKASAYFDSQAVKDVRVLPVEKVPVSLSR